MITKLRATVLFALLVSIASPALPQSAASGKDQGPGGGGLERVRALYAAASYEEALAAIPGEATATGEIEVEQYRALCLLALGREAEAIAALERLVQEHPTYLPPEKETSPRMRTLFSTVRTSVLPRLAQDVYTGARTAFDAKDDLAAAAGFRRAIEIIDSLPEAERAPLADLRVLASGFVDLAAARAVPAATEKAGSAKDATAEAPRSVYTGPVAIDEQLPAWIPPDGAARWTEYAGLLRVTIDERGLVTSAKIVRTSHPAYDAELIASARQWTYQPATRDGRPVASEKSIEIRLRPR